MRTAATTTSPRSGWAAGTTTAAISVTTTSGESCAPTVFSGTPLERMTLHYKWRVKRSNGVPENTVTGSADPYEKFLAFAKALEMAIGNPMYHWSNMELHKYFGITEP
ncbi:MAG: glucuronate isomerase, partial [Lachnospiraceae bacterium]|nr:glucuronate isomerase [Lachnospiraceae bacterium]